jgi:hypothetical protein
MTTITDADRRDMVESAATFPLGCGDWARARDHVRSGTWAVLASLAIDSLRPDYRGDLYRLARWLEMVLIGEREEFFYAAASCGTLATRSRPAAEVMAGPEGEVYIVTVRRQGGQGWQLCVSLDTTWRGLR